MRGAPQKYIVRGNIFNSMIKESYLSVYWKQNQDKLKDFICKKVNGMDHCNDILHDLFFKIRANEEKIALLEKPSSYIIKMAQNAVIDYYRQQQMKFVVDPAVVLNNWQQEISDNEIYNISLLPFIERLPATYREAIVMSELEGVSQKEMANRLGISYTAVKSRVQRARKMLKQSILDCCNYRFDKFGNILGINEPRPSK